MKILKLTLEQDKEFACLWSALLNPENSVTTSTLRMFNRLVEKLESISEGNAEFIDSVERTLYTKEGQTVVGVWVVNRKLTIENDIKLEFEDSDFSYLLDRVKKVNWKPASAKFASNLIDILEEAGKEQ